MKPKQYYGWCSHFTKLKAIVKENQLQEKTDQ